MLYLVDYEYVIEMNGPFYFALDKSTLIFHYVYAITYGGAYNHENYSPMGTF